MGASHPDGICQWSAPGDPRRLGGVGSTLASWRDFAAAEPEMAGLFVRLLEPVPIAYLATVRRDGAPRVHPVCPIIVPDGLFVAVAGSGRDHPSPKRWDLLRDGRYALHAMPGKQDAEFYITGRALHREDADVRDAVGAAAGFTIHAADDLFELRLDLAMSAHWENWSQPDTYAVRRFWRPSA